MLTQGLLRPKCLTYQPVFYLTSFQTPQKLGSGTGMLSDLRNNKQLVATHYNTFNYCCFPTRGQFIWSSVGVGAVSLGLAQVLCQLFTLQTETQSVAGIPWGGLGEIAGVFVLVSLPEFYLRMVWHCWVENQMGHCLQSPDDESGRV